MAAEQDTPEVAAIITRIRSLLDTNKNKLDIDLTKDAVEFKQHSGNLFTSSKPVAITLGFKDEGGITKDSSIEQFRSGFNFIALDKLLVPGLDGVPPQWQIYPQTSISSFSDGVTLEKYDASTQVLQLSIQTSFFAIYGSIPQEHPIGCGAAPKGTYLQVRRDIQGVIKLRAKLIFN